MLSLVVVKFENWKWFLEEECQLAKEKYSSHFEEIIVNVSKSTYFKEFTLSQEVPQLYYFVITDCHHTWKGDKEVDLKIFSYLDAEITVKNTDGTHFSLEDQQMIFPCVFTMLMIFCFIAFNLKKMLGLYREQEIIDYPLLLTGMALFCEFTALGLQLANLLYYENYGSSHFLYSFMQLFFETATNFLFTLIFIFVAWGWSINFMDISNFDFFVPTLAVIGAANIILVVLNRILFENDEKPSIEGFSLLNYIYLVYKIGFFAYFIIGLIRTYGLARNKIRGFVVKFIFLGILFFVSYGILLWISDNLVLHRKKKFLLIGNEIINMMVTLSLMRIFNSKIYMELSFKGKSVLPQEDIDLPKYI
jgi:hypothetical protein